MTPPLLWAGTLSLVLIHVESGCRQSALLAARLLEQLTLKPQLTAFPSQASRMGTDFCAFVVTHPTGESATRPLARPGGRPALSLLLAGMSLPRRRFAPGIPPKRTNSLVQLRFQGLSEAPELDNDSRALYERASQHFAHLGDPCHARAA